MSTRPARSQDIAYLRAKGYPPSIIGHFQLSEPAELMDISGVRMYPIEVIRAENEDTTPGYIAMPLGYLNIASTMMGDAYCLDLNCKNDSGEHPVVLVSHDLVDEETTKKDMPDVTIQVAESFDEFLSLFNRGQLPADFWHLKDS